MKASHRKLVEDDGLRGQLKTKSRKRREDVSSLVQTSGARSNRNDLLPNAAFVSVSPQQLLPPKRNVRKITPTHLQEVIGSIQSFGFCVPPLIDAENRVLDGVIRVEAAKRLGLPSIQCVRVDHLNPQDLRLFRTAINRLGEKGQWDLGELKTELSELIADGVAIDTSGFTAAEIDQIIIDDEIDPEEAEALSPDLEREPMAKPGDLFVLGRHRILCGDAIKPESYQRLMQGLLARLVLTDPPYNVPIAGHVTKGTHREFVMASGEMSAAEFASFNEAWIATCSQQLVDGGILASFIDWRGYPSIYDAAHKSLLHQLNLVVWTKTNGGLGSLYRSQHELIPIFKKGSAPHTNNVELGRNGRWRSNVWNYPGASSLGSDSRKGLEFHPTVKPVSMLEDAILDVTKRDDIVLDPFLGSGSTLIAAERQGRSCYGIELDPRYVDLAIRRFETTTGQPPLLQETTENLILPAVAEDPVVAPARRKSLPQAPQGSR